MINIDFHIQATVVATVNMANTENLINISFDMNSSSLTMVKPVIVPDGGLITNEVLHQDGHLLYGLLVADLAVVTFISLAATGRKTTIPAQAHHSANGATLDQEMATFALREGKTKYV